MKTRILVLAACVAAVSAPIRADDTAPMAALLKDKAPAIVSIKFVLKLQITMGGQQQEHEINREVHGVVVGDQGLIMTGNNHFEGGFGRGMRMRRQMEIKATPKDIKVLFGNEQTEFDARLVARDSNLDLAFVQILDLKDRKIQAVDLTKPVELSIGQELVGVSRMGRGFDCAPLIVGLRVAAKIEKPRPMWLVAGDFSALGHPVFDLAGTPVGVMALQQGSGGVDEDSGVQAVLLPLDAVAVSIKGAQTRATEALEEGADEEEAPAEEAPKEEAPKKEEQPEEPAEPEDGGN